MLCNNCGEQFVLDKGKPSRGGIERNGARKEGWNASYSIVQAMHSKTALECRAVM